jgi:hypothetical protein
MEWRQGRIHWEGLIEEVDKWRSTANEILNELWKDFAGNQNVNSGNKKVKLSPCLTN